MRQVFKSILAVGVVALVPTLVLAQVPGGRSYPGSVPGYYYSPGGYSGGYYFSPGYYPNPASPRAVAPVAVSPARSSYYGMSSYRGAGGTAGSYDYSTGRTNLSIPLAKPWLRPLR